MAQPTKQLTLSLRGNDLIKKWNRISNYHHKENHFSTRSEILKLLILKEYERLESIGEGCENS